AIRVRPGSAALLGLVMGLVADSLEPHAFGAGALGMCLVGFGASWLKAVFFADDVVLNALFFFCGKWAFDVIVLLAAHQMSGGALLVELLVWSPLKGVVSGGLAVLFLLLLGAFFRTQIVENSRYALQSEENRLREVPLPAPRGIIYDRHNEVLAENVPGYSVSLLSPSADSLRASLERLAAIVPLSDDEIDLSVRRYRRAPYRPTVVLSDASFD